MNRRDLFKAACWGFVAVATGPAAQAMGLLPADGSVGCFIGPFYESGGAVVVILFDEFECQQMEDGTLIFQDSFEGTI